MNLPDCNPNYLLHDAQYRKLRAQGKVGWTNADEIAEAVADVNAMLARNNLRPPGDTLELGCGTGELTLHMTRLGYNAHGIDIAPAAIEWAVENLSHRHPADASTDETPVLQGTQRARDLHAAFRVGNVVTLDAYANASFDIVLDGLCLHCIIGSHRATCLTSIRRVLAPGGIFHVRTMVGEINDPAIRDGYDPQTRCVFRSGIPIRYVGRPEDVLNELKTAGFSIRYKELRPARTDRPDTDALIVDAI